MKQNKKPFTHYKGPRGIKFRGEELEPAELVRAIKEGHANDDVFFRISDY